MGCSAAEVSRGDRAAHEAGPGWQDRDGRAGLAGVTLAGPAQLAGAGLAGPELAWAELAGAELAACRAQRVLPPASPAAPSGSQFSSKAAVTQQKEQRSLTET